MALNFFLLYSCNLFCTVEKLRPILLGPGRSSRKLRPVLSRIAFFLIALAPPQVHFGLAAMCSSVRAPLAFAGSVGRSIQQATAAESSAGAAGLLPQAETTAMRRSCGQRQPSSCEQQRRRSICCIVPYPSIMYVGNPSKFSWF